MRGDASQKYNLRSAHSVLVLLFLAIFFCCSLQPLCVRAQTAVTMWHYNNALTSANTTETLLTPANVNARSFGKLFTRPVDGFVVGQPLYLPNLTMADNSVRNVVFVATMHDSVYAFDAYTAGAAPLWTTSLLNYSPAGATPVPINVKGCASTVAWTETGVISTPVIDSASNTIYLVAETYESGKVIHRLHALDVTTGQEKLGGPATIAASYQSNGKTYTFVDTHQMNRPGLLLVNGHIYIGFGGASCNGSDQGWIMSYNASTLAQEGAFDLEPGGQFASVWQKGAALSADSSGDVYAESGEGTFNPGVDLGSSVMKVSQVGQTLPLADWFTPYNWSYLNHYDQDLNDGVLILPDQPGPFPHELIAEGKVGTVYVLNRDDMGQNCPVCSDLTGDSQVVQELPSEVGRETGTPVYWNNTVYFTGAHSVRAYKLNNGQLITPPAQSAIVPANGHSILTSDGNLNGILWSVGGTVLWAMDPITLKVIYTSAQAPSGRDALPPFAHFATPIVADGQVFFGTQNSLVVYGLLPRLSASAGNQQNAIVGTTLPNRISVQAIDSAGITFPGVTVTFSDNGANGSFNPLTAVTDDGGTASTTYTLPLKAGTYNLSATAAGYATALFSETGTPSGTTGLSRAGGSGQSAPVQTLLPKALVVKAHDQYNNGVPDIMVNFNDNGAGGTFSATSVITNSKGLATVNYTTGTRTGTVTITATASGLTPLKFFVTVTAQ
ncbi:MAG: hypothetical protein JWO91_3915 [Acidobacteriaceae bacterium]|nr:hypothetical protein [Acidobacteriaceae bacterium]